MANAEPVADVLPAGSYRLEMREAHAARFPVFGRTRTTWVSVSLARVRREGEALFQEHRLCDVRFESGLPLVGMEMPDPMRESLVRPPYPVELSRDPHGGWRYRADLGFDYVGYAPAEPGAPPPQRQNDPEVIDSDGDGKPGATLYLTVPVLEPLELYVVRRGRAVLEGRVMEDGRVEGGLTAELDQVVIGSDPYFLKRSPELEPMPDQSSFLLVPVAADSTCQSLLEAPQTRAVERPGVLRRG